jgi:hypothetical protein
MILRSCMRSSQRWFKLDTIIWVVTLCRIELFSYLLLVQHLLLLSTHFLILFFALYYAFIFLFHLLNDFFSLSYHVFSYICCFSPYF